MEIKVPGTCIFHPPVKILGGQGGIRQDFMESKGERKANCEICHELL